MGMNYTIIFTKGIFTINPIEIVVKTENYSKIYGQMDPAFTYTIVEGKLIKYRKCGHWVYKLKQ